MCRTRLSQIRQKVIASGFNTSFKFDVIGEPAHTAQVAQARNGPGPHGSTLKLQDYCSCLHLSANVCRKFEQLCQVIVRQQSMAVLVTNGKQACLGQQPC